MLKKLRKKLNLRYFLSQPMRLLDFLIMRVKSKVTSPEVEFCCAVFPMLRIT